MEHNMNAPHIIYAVHVSASIIHHTQNCRRCTPRRNENRRSATLSMTSQMHGVTASETYTVLS
jgi:hypothetical protein